MPKSRWGIGPVMVKDLALYLGRERRQVDKALVRLGIAPFQHGGDRRAHWITAEQARGVADHLTRSVRPVRAKRREARGATTRASNASGGRLDAAVERIESELQTLRQAVDTLEQQIAALQMGRAEARAVRTIITPEDETLRVGSHRALRQAIAFVGEIAERRPGPRERTIYVTYQGGRDPFRRAPILVDAWWRALRRALDQGWDVVHLIREVDDGSVPLALVSAMLRLLGASRAYAPRIFKAYHLGFFPQVEGARGLGELVVVPGVAAFELYASRRSEYLDTAVRHEPGGRCDLLSDYVRAMRRDSELLIETFGGRRLDFHQATTEADMLDGARGLIMDGPSAGSAPPKLFRARAERLLRAGREGIDRDWVETLCDSQRLRFERIERNLERGATHIREVYSAEAFARYAREGIPARDDIIYTRDHEMVPAAERSAHLAWIIKRLERHHPHYEIGFSREGDRAEHGGEPDPYWMFKRGYGVLLEAWPHSDGSFDKETDLLIKNAAMADVFAHYFEDYVWQRLEPTYRSKDGVIDYLTTLRESIL